MIVYIPFILTGVFLFLFLLERLVPLRSVKHSLKWRLWINFCVTTLAFAINAVLVQPPTRFTMQRTIQLSLGLTHVVELPAAVEFALTFLLMDLTFYYWHRANHRFSFLWRFHNVHHIDPDMDVSTAFRFHFVEIALSTGFRIFQIALIGVSTGTFALYELIFLANTLFHHSNVRLPVEVERLLNIVLVTPRMHGIHHSQVQDETNSNYSVIFPWWDRLHHTLHLNILSSEITIGIPAYSDVDDNKLQNLLIMPFQKQRDYWQKSDQLTIKPKESVSCNNKVEDF
ncbi:MAG: sterol desaturase family protein [Rhizonema sp. PD38]|nr:sterol desaturase family protein [Rhizonema sp. PD38]